MEEVNEDVLAKVRKLLAQAEDPACTEKEAEAFSGKATALMAKYAIDKALLAAKAKFDLEPEIREIHLGDGYIQAKFHLATIIAESFHCTTLRTLRRNSTKYREGKDGKVEVFGYASDIDAFLILYTSLYTQAHNQAMANYPGDIHLKRWKHAFITGFAEIIRERLAIAQQEATAEATTQEPGTAIVLRDRSLAVKKLVETTYPKLQKLKFSVQSESGYKSGQRAGECANLHNSNSVGGTNRRTLGR